MSQDRSALSTTYGGNTDLTSGNMKKATPKPRDEGDKRLVAMSLIIMRLAKW